jgi:hypothetical protein
MVRFGANIPGVPGAIEAIALPGRDRQFGILNRRSSRKQRTAGLYVGSFKLVWGRLCYLPESAIARTSRHFPFVPEAAISSLARRRAD